MPTVYSRDVVDWGLRAIAHVRNVQGCQVTWPYAECEGGVEASLVCERCNIWFTLMPDALLPFHGDRPEGITNFVRSCLKMPHHPPWPLFNQTGRIQLLSILREQAQRGLYPGEMPFELLPPTSPRTSWARLLSSLDD